MAVIELETIIQADLVTCFDLSRSIDLHTLSTADTKEKAIAGKVTGLIGMGETVTWQATHFFIRQKLTSKITAYTRPYHFKDEQLKGPFQSLVHDHFFTETSAGTLMKDTFHFKSPAGFLGRLVDRLILTRYLQKFLIQRNNMIKQYAETGEGSTLILKLG